MPATNTLLNILKSKVHSYECSTNIANECICTYFVSFFLSLRFAGLRVSFAHFLFVQTYTSTYFMCCIVSFVCMRFSLILIISKCSSTQSHTLYACTLAVWTLRKRLEQTEKKHKQYNIYTHLARCILIVPLIQWYSSKMFMTQNEWRMEKSVKHPIKTCRKCIFSS